MNTQSLIGQLIRYRAKQVRAMRNRNRVPFYPNSPFRIGRKANRRWYKEHKVFLRWFSKIIGINNRIDLEGLGFTADMTLEGLKAREAERRHAVLSKQRQLVNREHASEIFPQIPDSLKAIFGDSIRAGNVEVNVTPITK